VDIFCRSFLLDMHYHYCTLFFY